MTLKIQEAPQAPSYAAASIQVPANIATPQATMNSVKDQQSQLNAVNTLTGGRKRRVTKYKKRTYEYKHKSFIRTYKGRRYLQQQQQQQQQQHQQQQKGGSGERIPIPQVGSTCAAGPQCAGAQNASFTALHNQAQSNSINDAYVQQSGGGGTYRNHRTNKTRHRKREQSLSSMLAYNIKKVMRKVFS
jgi:hypothetical protein